MREEQLCALLGEVREDFIVEAWEARRSGWSLKWMSFGAVACLLLVIFAAGRMGLYVEPEYSLEDALVCMEDITQVQESQMIPNGNGYAEIEELVESKGEEVKESTQATQNDSLKNMGNVQEESADVGNKYMEAVTIEDFTVEAADVFGGSFLDDVGNFTVVLTEDTPENRALVCKELELSEDSVVFVVGEYTLEYLTELQAKISQSMMNKELPFVVSSGVYERGNRIQVRVTTRDEAELEKLFALDVLGDAIIAEYVDGECMQLDILLGP